jgi:DNA-binding MarR family transcriptional regulator
MFNAKKQILNDRHAAPDTLFTLESSVMAKNDAGLMSDVGRASPDICNASIVTDTYGYLIRRANDQAIRFFYESLADYGLAPTAYATLAVVDGNPGVRQGMVALALGLQESNISSLIKDLMKRRLLLRVRSEDDGRAYGLKLTNQGHNIIREMSPKARHLDLRQTRNLSSEEREILLLLLKKLLGMDVLTS